MAYTYALTDNGLGVINHVKRDLQALGNTLTKKDRLEMVAALTDVILNEMITLETPILINSEVAK